jgi:hypothetical protein
MNREIAWPGNQLNGINDFRENCYRQCQLNNPTDSGWYSKTDECGESCRQKLKEYEYSQGKNPCELKLQAPVFWYESPQIHESYQEEDKDKGKGNNKINIIYITLFIIMIVLIALSLIITILE